MLIGSRKPNTLGVDTFVFFIMPRTIIPHTADDCVKNGNGWGCSSYIMKNGNMKYYYK
jgi:hypothetical protein